MTAEPEVLLGVDVAALLLGVDPSEVTDRVLLWTRNEQTGEVLVPAFQIGEHGRLNRPVADAAALLLTAAPMAWVVTWLSADVDGHARWTLAETDPQQLVEAASAAAGSMRDHPAWPGQRR